MDVGTYEEALEHALADGILTEEEEAQLESLKNDMLRNAHYVAREDDVSTADERALMRKLAAHMVEHREELFWRIFGAV